MTADAVAVVRFIFTSIWSLFTSWFIPGTVVSPAAWWFFSLGVVAALRLIKISFSGGGPDGGKC